MNPPKANDSIVPVYIIPHTNSPIPIQKCNDVAEEMDKFQVEGMVYQVYLGLGKFLLPDPTDGVVGIRSIADGTKEVHGYDISDLVWQYMLKEE